MGGGVPGRVRLAAGGSSSSAGRLRGVLPTGSAAGSVAVVDGEPCNQSACLMFIARCALCLAAILCMPVQ